MYLFNLFDLRNGILYLFDILTLLELTPLAELEKILPNHLLILCLIWPKLHWEISLLLLSLVMITTRLMEQVFFPFAT